MSKESNIKPFQRDIEREHNILLWMFNLFAQFVWVRACVCLDKRTCQTLKWCGVYEKKMKFPPLTQRHQWFCQLRLRCCLCLNKLGRHFSIFRWMMDNEWMLLNGKTEQQTEQKEQRKVSKDFEQYQFPTIAQCLVCIQNTKISNSYRFLQSEIVKEIRSCHVQVHCS